MSWYHWLTIGCLAFCVTSCLWHFIRLLHLGKSVDLSQPIGSESDGIIYSFFNAMSPAKKESAYLHLPTYTAGLIYHLGTFISLLVLVASFLKIYPHGMILLLLAAFMVLSAISGLFILIKRIMVRKLRLLSNPDDYISNGLVTAFQAATAGQLLFWQTLDKPYFLIASALFLYLPLGKLKHVIYFFSARYHLGVFFGRRGVWSHK